MPNTTKKFVKSRANQKHEHHRTGRILFTRSRIRNTTTSGKTTGTR